MRTPIPQGLYLITDDERPATLLQRTEAAINGGAKIVQLRGKKFSSEQRLDLGRKLQSLCRRRGVLFIINDSPQLARTLDADGVHLGQGDGSIAEARAIVGENRIIGRSTRTLDQVHEAYREGADYIGFGSVFPTGTKRDAKLVGLEALAEICKESKLPVVAIGGIHRDNAPLALEAGAHSLAVVSAVMGDSSPAIAAREISLLFNARQGLPRGKVLSVAGSDSGGGAGIQADIKTISLLGSHAMTAITALTAQNSLGVISVHAVPGESVRDQIRAVTADIGVDLIKTGMLCTLEAVREVAVAIDRTAALCVVDPVMRSSSGTPLLSAEGIEALRSELIPRCYLLTPNLGEAAELTGIEVADRASMEQAARALYAMGARNVLIKGGHLSGDALDLLFDGKQARCFSEKRRDTKHTHGTGCTYASAITAFLAQGEPLIQAVRLGKQFITASIASALPMGSGTGPVNQVAAARGFASK